MEFPLTWKPYGYHSCVLTRRTGEVMCECGVWPREFEVQLHSRDGYQIHSFCSKCADGYFPSTDMDGEQSVIGCILTGSSAATPVRVAIAELNSGDPRWTVRVEFGVHSEALGTGWYRTRVAAVLAWMERSKFQILSVDPEFQELYDGYVTRRDAERQAKQDAAAAESRRKEEEYQRSNSYWTAVEQRARAMKGKRGTILLHKEHREANMSSSPASREPVKVEVSGTVYRELGIHRNEYKYERNKFHITHIPTGLRVGEGYPTQIEAKMAICLLLESGIDWKNLTADLSDRERLTIRSILTAVRTRVPEAVIGAVA